MTNEEKKEFKQLVKEGAIEALRSQEAKEILLDNFVEAFHEVVVPILEKHEDRIDKLGRKVGLTA